MRKIGNVAAQGDGLFIKVSSIPSTAKLAAAVDGKFVVLHSESGHVHTVERAKAELYEVADDAFVAYIRTLGDGAEIVHNRDHDTHETIALEPNTIYQVRRQREYVPEGYRAAQD